MVMKFQRRFGAITKVQNLSIKKTPFFCRQENSPKENIKPKPHEPFEKFPKVSTEKESLIKCC